MSKSKKPQKVNKLLKAALGYASRGWPVLPLHWPIEGRCSCWKKHHCANPGKHPLTPHGKDDASTDPATIRRWWERWPEANIGIATGKQSGFLVLNINPRDGLDLDDFMEILGFFDDNLKFPAALTGGAGLHYYFQYPEDDLEIPEQLPGFPGIYLMGAGDYVVAPPSRHASGECYKWTPGSKAAPIVPLPASLMRLIKPELRFRHLEVVRDHSRGQEQLQLNKPGGCYES
jgi:putative DNA primase/helicase